MFLKIIFISEWWRLHQPPRAGLCGGQFGTADEIEVVFEKIDFIISFDFQIEGDPLKYR